MRSGTGLELPLVHCQGEIGGALTRATRAYPRRTVNRPGSGAVWHAAHALTGPAFSPALSRRRWQSVQKV